MGLSSHSSSMSSLKMFLMTFITLTVLAIVAHGYLGPRYGKRLPSSGEVSRIVGRSSGPRTIQSRSQARFYAGSRYGGKRSYWPSLVAPDMDISENSLSNSPPYDCIFVPYLGVRCAVKSEEMLWPTNDNDDEGPNPSSSMIRTSIIDGNGVNPPTATGAVMGSEA